MNGHMAEHVYTPDDNRDFWELMAWVMRHTTQEEREAWAGECSIMLAGLDERDAEDGDSQYQKLWLW